MGSSGWRRWFEATEMGRRESPAVREIRAGARLRVALAARRREPANCVRTSETSAVTSKAASGGHFKTGQLEAARGGAHHARPIQKPGRH